MENFVVKKWGGENASELVRSPQNVVNDFLDGVKQAVVVSAIRSSDFNTTDNLISIGEALKNGEDVNAIISKIENLKQFHIDIVNEKLGNSGKEVLSYIEMAFIDFIKNINNYLQSYNTQKPQKQNDYSIETENGFFSIIGFGENLSANIHSQVINSLKVNGLEAETVDLNGVVPINSDELTDNELFDSLSSEISNRVNMILNLGKVPVIPGYIPGFKKGIENAIGRGYSDATAGIVSVGMSKTHEVTLEIQKSVSGMLSADPRIVENAILIPQIDYITAKEITGARGARAKLLHNQTLREELLEAGVNIKLFDPFSGNPGTLISEFKNENSSGIEFVGGRNITLFSVSSWNMDPKGILSYIFSVVKDYSSVHIVSTSETEINFTIDDLTDEELEEISLKIKKYLNIKDNLPGNFVRHSDASLVFCIGQNIFNDDFAAANIFTSLARSGIKPGIISKGDNDRAIAIGVKKSELKRAIQVLHRDLIN